MLAAKAKAAAAATADAAKAKKAADMAKRAAGCQPLRGAHRAARLRPDPRLLQGVFSGNRAIGCALMLEAGFGLDQMPCLDKLWTKESDWRTTAENTVDPGRTASRRRCPAAKMAEFGSDWKTNPVPQIKWGLQLHQEPVQGLRAAPGTSG